MQKFSIIFISSLLLLYVLLCNYAYTEMFLVDLHKDECLMKAGNNTFKSYRTFVKNCEDWEHVDMSDYFLNDDSLELLESVTFNASDGFGPIDAWFLPSDAASGHSSRHTVIVVHGFRVCKHHFTSLIVSAMLHRNGYNVLLFDLRNHGRSAKQHPTPYATFGSKEHFDVIGAVNYLHERFGNEHKVGLYGVSMGGATSLVAAARDSRLNAIYLDSPPCKIYDLMHGNVHQLFLHLPVVKDYISSDILASFSHAVMRGVCVIGKIKSGGDYGCPPFEFEPSVELTRMNGTNKAFHFDHARLDTLVPVMHTEHCSEIIKRQPHKGISVNIQDKVGRVLPKWNTTCKDHTVMTLIKMEERDYERRMISFFNSHL